VSAIFVVAFLVARGKGVYSCFSQVKNVITLELIYNIPLAVMLALTKSSGFDSRFFCDLRHLSHRFSLDRPVAPWSPIGPRCRSL